MTAENRPIRRGVARWDAWVVTGALVFLSAVAWLGVARSGDGMAVGLLTQPEPHDGMAMPSAMAPMGLALFMATWTVMMVAMMFPATAPVVLLFDRWRRSRARSVGSTVSFVAGYLLVWAFAGLLAYAALIAIDRQVPSSTTAVRVGGLVLMVAGLYQAPARSRPGVSPSAEHPLV